MSIRPAILSKTETALIKTELVLINRRFRVLQFTQSEHTVEENLKLRAQIIEDQKKLDRLLKSLRANKNIAIDYRVEADRLCSECREMNNYTREMFSLLSNDFDKQQRIEEKKAAEAAKNKPTDYAMKFMSLFGLPSVLATIVDRMGGTKTEVGEAAGAGFAITGIYFYKDLKKDENLKDLVIKSPSLIKRGAHQIYHSETIMNTRVGAILAFQAGKEAVGTRVVKRLREQWG